MYFGWGTVHIEAEPDALVPYIQGDKTLRTMRCRNCGVVTHWEPLPAESGARHGVNLANFEPALIAAVPTRKFDWAVSWRFADDLQRDTDMLQALYAAINANNIEATAAQFAPEITRTEPDGFSGAGTYDGATAVQACLAQGRNTWAEGTCEPEQFFAYGPKMVVYLHVRVRLNGSTDWVDARFADGLALQNGKITEWRSFNDRSAAMAWAGIAG